MALIQSVADEFVDRMAVNIVAVNNVAVNTGQAGHGNAVAVDCMVDKACIDCN